MQPNEADLLATCRALSRNGFNARPVENREDAVRLVLHMVPPAATVAIGGSITLSQLGIVRQLRQRGNTVVNPIRTAMRVGWGEARAEMRQALLSDAFVTSSNAVTRDGKLVNMDMTGNRVAAMIFGPAKVIVVAGQNKVVGDIAQALAMIKDVVAPYHARAMGRKTPCVKSGVCSNCDSPERICNATVILEKRPILSDIAVILVAEDLGLGWQAGWPQARIDAIKSEYDSISRPVSVPAEGAVQK